VSSVRDSVADRPAAREEPADGFERYGTLGAVALVALGLGLRLRGFADYWLNPDEGIYYSTLTRASFGEFWAEVMANAHPPAFYLLLRGAGLLTQDFVVLRGTSLVFGTAAIWIFWLVGRELGGEGRGGTIAGWIAAGLIALSGEAIVFSQVLRPYMLLVALLAGALSYLLRYRAVPTTGRLVGYVVLLCVALLTHYSAALAFGVFLVVVAGSYFDRELDRRSWERLALAQLLPASVFTTLFALHLDAAMSSYMMSLALAPGGWLSEWLVRSPGDAWHGFASFQSLHLPPDFRVRSALMLIAAVVVSASTRDRLAAWLAGSAVTIALIVSYLGVYPFGPSRHNFWLIVFTMPAVAWLFGRVVEKGRASALATSGALVAALVLGAPIERALGGSPGGGSGTEERAIRRVDLRPVLDEYLDPSAEPRIVLMSFQTYTLLMPLYASERQDLTAASPPDIISFSYGSRDIVTVGQWDWAGWEHVRDVVRSLPARVPEVTPDLPDRLLLLAGGWESTLFVDAPDASVADAVIDSATVSSTDRRVPPTVRLIAFVLDGEALLGPSIGPR
jgi:hypothetical protein